MADCQIVLEVCQQEGERQDYALNWTDEFAHRWQPDHPYAAGERVRPSADRGPCGFELESSGGQSGGQEPNWKTRLKAIGDTVTEGGVTWTARAFSTSSLRHQIDGIPVWTPADGQTAEDQEETAAAGLQETRIWIEGGEEGETYEHSVLVTTDQGAIFKGMIRVTVDP